MCTDFFVGSWTRPVIHRCFNRYQSQVVRCQLSHKAMAPTKTQDPSNIIQYAVGLYTIQAQKIQQWTVQSSEGYLTLRSYSPIKRCCFEHHSVSTNSRAGRPVGLGTLDKKSRTAVICVCISCANTRTRL